MYGVGAIPYFGEYYMIYFKIPEMDKKLIDVVLEDLDPYSSTDLLTIFNKKFLCSCIYYRKGYRRIISNGFIIDHLSSIKNEDESQEQISIKRLLSL